MNGIVSVYFHSSFTAHLIVIVLLPVLDVDCYRHSLIHQCNSLLICHYISLTNLSIAGVNGVSASEANGVCEQIENSLAV